MTNPETVETEAQPGPADNDDTLFNELVNFDQGVQDFAKSLGPDDAPADDADGTAPKEGDGADDGDTTEPDAPEAKADDADATEDAPEPDTPPDPLAPLLAEAKPLTYKVNQQERVADHILEIEGKGAFIPADKVGDIRQMLSRYDSNAEASRELFQYREQVERLGGVQKFHETNERSAMTDAASVLILDAFTKNPRQFVNDDGTPNTERINFLIQQAGVHAERARYEYRQQREEQEGKWTAEASESETRESALPRAVEQAVQQLGLGPEDAQAALAHFGPFRDALYFKATPEQALQYGVKPGTLMVDLPKMEPWFRDRLAMRQRSAETAKKREQAAAENAARATTPTPPRKPNGQFTKPKASKAQTPPARKYSIHELKRLAMRGAPIPGDDDFSDD